MVVSSPIRLERIHPKTPGRQNFHGNHDPRPGCACLLSHATGRFATLADRPAPHRLADEFDATRTQQLLSHVLAGRKLVVQLHGIAGHPGRKPVVRAGDGVDDRCAFLDGGPFRARHCAPHRRHSASNVTPMAQRLVAAGPMPAMPAMSVGRAGATAAQTVCLAAIVF